MQLKPWHWLLIVGGIIVIGAGLRKWTTPERGRMFDPLFDAASKLFAVPASLLSRVAHQESRYNPQALNASSGASGIMQLVPKWYPGVDPFNPEQAIPAAAKSLRDYHQQFGSWSKALAAYNWGPGNLTKHLQKYGPNWMVALPAETFNYVVGVTRDTGFA